MSRASNECYKCIDCDEITRPNIGLNRVQICLTCGSTLVIVPAEPIARNTDPSPESLNDLFELFGADIRDSIMDAMSQSQPTRQISVSYLNTLGKVIIDDRKTILRDISLNIGPLHILAVSAQFGYLPEGNNTYSFPIICGMPICGESSLTNRAECQGSMVLLNRGVVSFASKVTRAIEAGAVAVIVVQTAGVWPFVMADTAQELVTNGIDLSIPVVMISQQDGELVRKMVREQEQHHIQNKSTSNVASAESSASSNASHAHSFEPVLKFSQSVCECSICQEDFAIGNSVLKLPCRHIYHTDCVTNWLAVNNTCPLCRLELPKEVEGKSLPNRTPAAPVDPSRLYYN